MVAATVAQRYILSRTRGSHRHHGSRLPHRPPARPADELLRPAANGRHRAASVGRPPGTADSRRQRRRRADPGRPGRGRALSDARLLVAADARLPRHGAALRATDALLGAPAAADVRQPRGGLRPLRVAADRRHPRHRDGESAGGRGRLPRPDARPLLGPGRPRVPRGVPDHDLPGRCPARDDPVADPLPLRRRAARHRRRDDARRVRGLQRARPAHERPRAHPALALGRAPDRADPPRPAGRRRAGGARAGRRPRPAPAHRKRRGSGSPAESLASATAGPRRRRFCPASTSTSPPARPSPSSGAAARARPRS